ncbi:hypothetical protein HDU77_007174, partial [Chytriomyces hyalinus]
MLAGVGSFGASVSNMFLGLTWQDYESVALSITYPDQLPRTKISVTNLNLSSLPYKFFTAGGSVIILDASPPSSATRLGNALSAIKDALPNALANVDNPQLQLFSQDNNQIIDLDNITDGYYKKIRDGGIALDKGLIEFQVPPGGRDPYQCPQCNKEYMTVSGLKRHIRGKYTEVTVKVRKPAQVSDKQRHQKRKDYAAMHAEDKGWDMFCARWLDCAKIALRKLLKKEGVDLNPSAIDTRAEVMLNSMFNFSTQASVKGKRRRMCKAQMYTDANIKKLDGDEENEDAGADRVPERKPDVEPERALQSKPQSKPERVEVQ